MFILLSNATCIPKYLSNYDVINMMMMLLVLLRELFLVYICYVRIFSSIFQGGVKILITGPWQEDSSSYTCLFDQICVPASLIQPGVLRCYCPGNFKFIHTVSHRCEYTPHIFVNILLYLFMWQHWRNYTLLQFNVVSVHLLSPQNNSTHSH